MAPDVQGCDDSSAVWVPEIPGVQLTPLDDNEAMMPILDEETCISSPPLQPQPQPSMSPTPDSGPATLGQCARNPFCVRGFRHGGRGGKCSVSMDARSKVAKCIRKPYRGSPVLMPARPLNARDGTDGMGSGGAVRTSEPRERGMLRERRTRTGRTCVAFYGRDGQAHRSWPTKQFEDEQAEFTSRRSRPRPADGDELPMEVNASSVAEVRTLGRMVAAQRGDEEEVRCYPFGFWVSGE